MSRGPVMEAYADGALERRCGNCGAEPSQFCIFPDGTRRHIPCLVRSRERRSGGIAGHGSEEEQ